VICAAWEEGQAASLRCGLDALPAEITEALIVLGDGPQLDPAAIARVSAGHGVRAADYGHGRSHPVVLPRPVWDALPRTGESPGRSLPATLVDCSDLAEPGDVDYAAS
jgi:molybdenum cofactor cytidylyltransferase